MKNILLSKRQMLSKKVIIPTAAVVILAAGSGVAAHNLQTRLISSKNDATTQVASTTTAPTDTTQTTTASPTTTTTTTQPATTATPAPSPTPAPTPEYGQSTTQPNVYEVFDKTAVMNDAGVPSDQQSDASQSIDMIRGSEWIYKMSDNTQAFWDDICKITPPKPKDPSIQIPPITDYRDSPVIQLKLCNIHAQDKYGGWANVLTLLKSGGVFD